MVYVLESSSGPLKSIVVLSTILYLYHWDSNGKGIILPDLWLNPHNYTYTTGTPMVKV